MNFNQYTLANMTMSYTKRYTETYTNIDKILTTRQTRVLQRIMSTPFQTRQHTCVKFVVRNISFRFILLSVSNSQNWLSYDIYNTGYSINLMLINQSILINYLMIWLYSVFFLNVYLDWHYLSWNLIGFWHNLFFYNRFCLFWNSDKISVW